MVLICILAVCAVSTLAMAGETKGLGFWKNHFHDSEYLCDDPAVCANIVDYADDAANLIITNVDNRVFGSKGNLTFVLGLKGKKNMLEHAKRHFAAMLLNVVDGLTFDTWLTQGELEIYQQTYPDALPGIKIGDALEEIESTIKAENDYYDPPVNSVRLEAAKDLAEEINGRGSY